MSQYFDPVSHRLIYVPLRLTFLTYRKICKIPQHKNFMFHYAYYRTYFRSVQYYMTRLHELRVWLCRWNAVTLNTEFFMDTHIHASVYYIDITLWTDAPDKSRLTDIFPQRVASILNLHAIYEWILLKLDRDCSLYVEMRHFLKHIPSSIT